jgi:septal ring factor EnvC (AmiA/AmiB activator)
LHPADDETANPTAEEDGDLDSARKKEVAIYQKKLAKLNREKDALQQERAELEQAFKEKEKKLKMIHDKDKPKHPGPLRLRK